MMNLTRSFRSSFVLVSQHDKELIHVPLEIHLLGLAFSPP